MVLNGLVLVFLVVLFPEAFLMLNRAVDAGNASLAKTMHMLGTGAVLYLSVPVFRAVLELLRDILGGI